MSTSKRDTEPQGPEPMDTEPQQDPLKTSTSLASAKKINQTPKQDKVHFLCIPSQLNTYTHTYTHTLLIPSQVDGTNEVRSCTCVSVFNFYIITLTHTLFKIDPLHRVLCVCLLISHALSFFLPHFRCPIKDEEEKGMCCLTYVC